ncbi:MAG: hypothetical protein KatS3mg068_1526 [Candidatus Sericytochromatia bacterium]|nr:MAG: hypothetical protein KatS3mg068_1526 [Candidatus Sericytochromatia bacterium]
MINLIDYKKNWNPLSYKGNKKTIIFLHHTAGYDIYSAHDWLYKLSLKHYREGNYLTGVNYFIGKDGTILQAIEEDRWAWHSGTGDKKFEAKTISIELDNLGFMWFLDKNTLVDLYNNKWEIVSRKDNEIKAKLGRLTFDFVYLEKPWRGFQVYHKYSKKQIDSLVNLLDDIIKRNGISRQIHKNFLPEKKTLNTSDLYDFSGIVNHVQFMGNISRSDHYIDKIKSYKKWDLSIVFPVEELISRLNLEVI